MVTNLGEGKARSRYQFAATEALDRDGFDALARRRENPADTVS